MPSRMLKYDAIIVVRALPGVSLRWAHGAAMTLSCENIKCVRAQRSKFALKAKLRGDSQLSNRKQTTYVDVNKRKNIN